MRRSTGTLAKPYNWRIASLYLVGISWPSSWSKTRGGMAGGIIYKGWWGKVLANNTDFCRQARNNTLVASVSKHQWIKL